MHGTNETKWSPIESNLELEGSVQSHFASATLHSTAIFSSMNTIQSCKFVIKLLYYYRAISKLSHVVSTLDLITGGQGNY